MGKATCTTSACATQPKKCGGLFNCFKGKGSICGTKSCGANAGCVNGGCISGGSRVCDANPCEIAELIYTSQTACYAWQRRRAVDDLGDYDAVCNPEVMVALIYALNDASEKVRAEAADEIGDLLDDGKACCSPQVVSALTCALGDCDWFVRRQAKEALEACGYEVEGAGCSLCSLFSGSPCGASGCGTSGCGASGCGAQCGTGCTNGQPPIQYQPATKPMPGAEEKPQAQPMPKAPAKAEEQPKAQPTPAVKPEAKTETTNIRTLPPAPHKNLSNEYFPSRVGSRQNRLEDLFSAPN